MGSTIVCYWTSLCSRTMSECYPSTHSATVLLATVVTFVVFFSSNKLARSHCHKILSSAIHVISPHRLINQQCFDILGRSTYVGGIRSGLQMVFSPYRHVRTAGLMVKEMLASFSRGLRIEHCGRINMERFTESGLG